MSTPEQNPEASSQAPKPKREKPKSRGSRWNEAAQDALDKIEEAVNALNDLYDVQQEYIEWRDNLPENLQSSALGEKLDTVADLDIEGATSSLEDAQGTVQEALDTDLPQGFGRD